MPRNTFVSRFSQIPNEIIIKEKVSLWEKSKKWMETLIENKFSNILFIILTLIALYLDDIRIGFTPKGADPYVDSIMLF